jgi:RNA polymerase sigma-70 factor, ECF subfamily
MGSNRTPDSIIRKAMSGDTQAFRAIVEDHQDFVFSVAFHFVNDTRDAEDLAQETFLRLWKNMARYKTDIKLTTWLYKIITNVCLDYLKSREHKRHSMEQGLEKSEHLSAAMQADELVIQDELLSLVVRAADTLTPKQKAVFVLRDLEGLDVSEVVAVLQMPAGNIKSNLCHARKKIGDIIRNYYGQVKNRNHEM